MVIIMIITEKQDTSSRVEKILIEKLNINTNLINSNYYNQLLTGRVFNLRSRDMIYLFFEIEKEFNIKINTLDILHNEFNTIHGVIEIIENMVSKLND